MYFKYYQKYRYKPWYMDVSSAVHVLGIFPRHSAAEGWVILEELKLLLDLKQMIGIEVITKEK